MNYDDNFPQLPSFGARWQPILFKPLPGSQECFTIAIAVKGANGEVKVTQVYDYKHLRCLFGSAASAISDKIKLCIRSAENTLDSQLSLDDWQAPLFGFYSGKSRSALAHDLDGVIRQAARLGTVFGSSYIIDEEEDADAAEQRNSLWIRDIRKHVKSSRSELAKLFDYEVQTISGKITEKVGFLNSRYAANFAVVNPVSKGYKIALRSAQARLWQLHLLRDLASIDRPEVVELVVGHPDINSSMYTDLEVNRLNDGIEELEFEAKRHQIDIYSSSNPTTAAEHIIQRSVA